MLSPVLRPLRYRDIRFAANDCLRKYVPSGGSPVDVEKVVDCQLKIDIVPVDNLEDKFRIDGMYDLYRHRIYVDAKEFRSKTNRFRFTLAHELGHLVLHVEHIRRMHATQEEYLRLLAGLSDRIYSQLEYEASCFAGLFLLPAASLRPFIREANVAAERVATSTPSSDSTRMDFITDYVARRACVSRQVVQIRGFYDGHWPRQP